MARDDDRSKNPAYPKAAAEMKGNGELWWRCPLRQTLYVNNVLQQDHRGIKPADRGATPPESAPRSMADSATEPPR
jgi:transposase-like protein